MAIDKDGKEIVKIIFLKPLDGRQKLKNKNMQE